MCPLAGLTLACITIRLSLSRRCGPGTRFETALDNPESLEEQ